VKVYSRSASRTAAVNFSEHGGLTLRGDDEVRVECHLIVNSLSGLVNTGCTTSAGSNGEQCGRTVCGIWL